MMNVLHNCPSTLAGGFATYSPAALRRLFDGKKVSHVLPYHAPTKSDADAARFMDNRKRISISGVQEKLSLIQDKNTLRLTRNGEQGTHLLKPIPTDLKKVALVPANEHLTMQIAAQVYGINIAPCGIIFFADGEPAFITKRFDVKKDGTKWGVEDFASIAGKTAQNAGANFKYEYSYEEIGQLIRTYVPAWRVEIEKYFRLVVFNYLLANGDAHLKNFSLLESDSGDYFLSPAYDLINTRIHVDDSDFALNKGLFADGFKSATWLKTTHAGKEDFVELGRRIGIPKDRAEKLLIPFLTRQEKVDVLTSQSFLPADAQRGYLLHYNTRRNRLNA